MGEPYQAEIPRARLPLGGLVLPSAHEALAIRIAALLEEAELLRALEMLEQDQASLLGAARLVFLAEKLLHEISEARRGGVARDARRGRLSEVHMRLESASVGQLPGGPRAPMRQRLARLARLGALLALAACTTQEQSFFFVENKTSATLTILLDAPDGGFRGTPWKLPPGDVAPLMYAVGGCNPFYPGEYKFRNAYAAGFTIEDAQGRRKHLPLDEILRRRERLSRGLFSNANYALELDETDLSK